MAPNQDFYPTKPPIPRHDNVVGPVVAAGIVAGTIVVAELSRPLPANTAKGACVLERVTGPQVPTHTCVLERVTGMGRGDHPYLCPGKSDWYGWWLPKILYFLPVLPSN